MVSVTQDDQFSSLPPGPVGPQAVPVSSLPPGPPAPQAVPVANLPPGPSGPFRRPPSPTDFMTDGMPPIPSAENRAPIYKGPLAIDVKIGQEVQEQLHVHDPDGDPISYS